MRVGGLLLGLILLVYHGYAQVTVYSNPEPLHGLNSVDDESYLYLSPDGVMVFTREKSKANKGGKSDPGDLWFSRNGVIDSSRSEKMGGISWLQTPLGYSSDGQYFLYSETSKSMGQYYGKVMVYNPEDDRHVEIEIPHFSSLGEAQNGFLSRDGRILILSMENKTGYGVEDLYVSFLNAQGKWSAPKGLGSQINTEYQEITPFLAPDNKTLYFATNGRDGFGSFDIFYATRLDDSWRSWSTPINLGSPINSVGAETSFMFNDGEDYAYFISTQNSDGYGDIKRVLIQPVNSDAPVRDTLNVPFLEESKVVTFKARDAKSDEPLVFKIISMLGDAQEVRSGGMQVGATQVIEYAFSEGDSVILEFKSSGYLSKTLHYTYDQIDESGEYVIRLEPLETGNTIVLENVLFYRGTDKMIETSQEELDLVREMMLENPEVKIFLKGHTDNVGNKMLNVQLSDKRVIAVKKYLVEKGIEAKRISGKGYGGSEPIADNRKEETRKLNRRVEFEVVRD
ncbi:OmpA family protein [Marinoscillum sp. MHG1-6]|uniref:OmpA family protein n=1 Tax=Marinoscillum sp. MHG1-6 TaxID=2959627 RepID=UPI0021575B5D|nr:OmpA family protein [Marinoscillum sp. MHG1-6]